MNASGDLVRVDEERMYCRDPPVLQSKSLVEETNERNTANWEEWCSGIDGLGGLVLLAASLIVA